MVDLFNNITSLAKRRGFVYPGSEIYGGLANTYDYGPLGVELLRNIKNLWWDHFVTKREDMLGLDTNILMNPKVWEASGHTASFTDAVVDCKECQNRKRADHLIEEYFEGQNKEIKVEGKTLDELDQIISENKIPCPVCGKSRLFARRNCSRHVCEFQKCFGYYVSKTSLWFSPIRSRVSE
ncbi:MAG: Glycine-tRNA ligase [Microgenomates group bacterium GW2011_GWC1_41_8]|nr:MAG: Glycine-tRNA ligase [Microgenomates group bacterium GW2011_GWC1_41_8]